MASLTKDMKGLVEGEGEVSVAGIDVEGAAVGLDEHGGMFSPSLVGVQAQLHGGGGGVTGMQLSESLGEGEEEAVIQYVPHARTMSKQDNLFKNSKPEVQIKTSISLGEITSNTNYDSETSQGKYFLTLHLLCDLSDFQLERVGNVRGVHLSQRLGNAKGLAQRFWGRVARPMAGIEHVGIIRQALREHMLKYPAVFPHGGIVAVEGIPAADILLTELMFDLLGRLKDKPVTKKVTSLTWKVLEYINREFCNRKHDVVLSGLSSVRVTADRGSPELL
jgi:hypothetical protein